MAKRLTEQRLLNITLFYLSRYESSTEKVRGMLKRRIRRLKIQGEEVPPEVDQWIETVIRQVQDKSYLDDSRYAENQVRSMAVQGKSDSFIRAKLAQAGIETEETQKLIDELGLSELERARHFAKKKGMGPFRPPQQRNQFREKDMAALARAGFSYDTVCEALKSPSDTE